MHTGGTKIEGENGLKGLQRSCTEIKGEKGMYLEVVGVAIICR